MERKLAARTYWWFGIYCNQSLGKLLLEAGCMELKCAFLTLYTVGDDERIRTVANGAKVETLVNLSVFFREPLRKNHFSLRVTHIDPNLAQHGSSLDVEPNPGRFQSRVHGNGKPFFFVVRTALNGAALNGATLDGATLDGAALDGIALKGAALPQHY